MLKPDQLIVKAMGELYIQKAETLKTQSGKEYIKFVYLTFIPNDNVGYKSIDFFEKNDFSRLVSILKSLDNPEHEAQFEKNSTELNLGGIINDACLCFLHYKKSAGKIDSIKIISYLPREAIKNKELRTKLLTEASEASEASEAENRTFIFSPSQLDYQDNDIKIYRGGHYEIQKI